MNRRAGLSLAEVMIAIFVLGLGLMGVLSLFPLGAVRMAQAIKDDRCQIHNLSMAANWHWVWRDETVYRNPNDPTNPTYRQLYLTQPMPNPSPTPPNYVGLCDLNSYGDRVDAFVNAMENPNYPPNPDNMASNDQDSVVLVPSPLYPSPQSPAVVRRGDVKPSYSVYIDPVGWGYGSNKATAQQYWLGGRVDSLPRRSMRPIEWTKDHQGH